MDEKDGPHSIDVLVGSRVRYRRRLLGITQQALGDELGITFQQIQKYERGANRISASKLAQIANALGTPVAFFFEGSEDIATHRDGEVVERLQQVVEDLLAEPDGRQLATAFLAIRNKAVKRSLAALAAALVDGADPNDVGHPLPH